MNLKDYFHQQQNMHMSDAEKLNLYQDFMLKNMRRHYARKRSFLHVKSFVYSIVVMFFLFSVYGVFFFTDRYNEYEGLIMNGENAVQASYIAKVIDFNGSFYIEHTGKRVQTSSIQDGDVITLKENTQLVVQINAGTKAKLIGPAQFSIQQVSAGKTPQYKLNIIKGDFIEMKSQDKPSEKIQLTINTITVQQANGNAIDYQLINAGGQHIVKNNGGSLSITTTDKNKKQTKTNLANEQVLAIGNNDIKLFDNMKKFADAMKTNNVSQIFTLNTAQETITAVNTGIDPDGIGAGPDSIVAGAEDIEQPLQEVPLASLLNTSDEIVDPSVSSQLGSLFSDSKKVVSPEQTQTIKSIINNEFLVSEVNKSILSGDENGLSNAYNNVERTIAKLHETFSLPFTKPAGTTIQEKLLSLKTSITSLIILIKNGYTLPEKYVSELTKFANQLENLAGLPSNF